MSGSGLLLRNGNIIYPSWWRDEEKKKTQMAHRREAP